MKPIREVSGPLEWIQPRALDRAWELRDADSVVATLEWISSYQAQAKGRTDRTEWGFTLDGFLNPWITIERLDKEEPSRAFRGTPSFNGQLELGEERVFSWDSNFWLTKWIWTTDDGTDLVRMSRNLSLKTEGTAEWDEEHSTLEELPLIAILGWYLIIQVTDIRPS